MNSSKSSHYSNGQRESTAIRLVRFRTCCFSGLFLFLLFKYENLWRVLVVTKALLLFVIWVIAGSSNSTACLWASFMLKIPPNPKLKETERMGKKPMFSSSLSHVPSYGTFSKKSRGKLLCDQSVLSPAWQCGRTSELLLLLWRAASVGIPSHPPSPVLELLHRGRG